METVTKPLYKVLNEQREKGDLSFNNHWRNGITLRRNEEKVCEFFGDFVEDAITAEYAAIAVNNFADIAENLERIIYRIEESNLQDNFPSEYKIAKEALKRIS